MTTGTALNICKHNGFSAGLLPGNKRLSVKKSSDKDDYISKKISLLSDKHPDWGQDKLVAVAYRCAEEEAYKAEDEEKIDDDTQIEAVEEEIQEEPIEQDLTTLSLEDADNVLNELIASKIIDKNSARKLSISQINELQSYQTKIGEILNSLGE